MAVTTSKMLAQVIREFRYKADLSQIDVAKRAGTKQATVSVFETNPDATKLETLFKILSGLELELIVQPRPTQQVIQQEQHDMPLGVQEQVADYVTHYNPDDEVW
ncbi:helix-turn-helix domain-containing protein [Lonepinella sp. BR2271]|uniref:helix-turn-helix domain-containing protein n=1 Tax=Lonepinella sp. BR2271 TaxID=3434550 RepID=UPI003F6DC7E5